MLYEVCNEYLFKFYIQKFLWGHWICVLENLSFRMGFDKCQLLTRYELMNDLCLFFFLTCLRSKYLIGFHFMCYFSKSYKLVLLVEFCPYTCLPSFKTGLSVNGYELLWPCHNKPSHSHFLLNYALTYHFVIVIYWLWSVRIYNIFYFFSYQSTCHHCSSEK